MAESPQLSGIQDLIRMIDEHLAGQIMDFDAEDTARKFRRETYPRRMQNYVEGYHSNLCSSCSRDRRAVQSLPDSKHPSSHFYTCDSNRPSSDSYALNTRQHPHRSIHGLRVSNPGIPAPLSQSRKRDGVVNFITALPLNCRAILKRVKRDHRSKMGRDVREEQDCHLHGHLCHTGHQTHASAPATYPRHQCPREPVRPVPQALAISKPVAGGFKWY